MLELYTISRLLSITPLESPVARAGSGEYDAYIMPVVTLLTDFGTSDAYVGAVKGVVLRALPEARIVDITHEVPRHDVKAAALVLESAFGYFPKETVHLVVVDPGVGSARRMLAAEAGGFRFVGPDNGVLIPALSAAGGALIVGVEAAAPATRRALSVLPEGASASSTFHGRDYFAPVAAALAGGAELSEFGPPLADPVRLEFPRPRRLTGGELLGEVIYVDRFGNLVTNLRPEDLDPEAGPFVFEIAGAKVSGLSTCYAEVECGGLLALVGSTGRIEVSVREGGAAERLRAGVGTPVVASGSRPLK